ncbi:NAD(P)/FAD-dependent oxidoreductase [Pseudomonas sp. BIOMIG1BAC]|uniref:NAD(P)/FAD-dependent oxidoreductase n=2 Tax=Pseudomonas TaxID=286 RepID=UPI000ADB2EED|nr:FAD-binding oxidoreductase [Pseudomonas sp. BIOMIG1BAC]
MSMTSNFDLVIVGGGIIGAWALHHAVERYPHWKILLIDRYRIGDGATSHSAGVLLATGRSNRERRLAGQSAKLYKALRDQFSIRTTQAPVYWLADKRLSTEILRAAVDFDVQPAEISESVLGARMGSRLNVGGAECLLRGGSAESYEPPLVARLLISNCLKSANINCIEGLGITGIRRSPRGTQLSLSDGASINSQRVLVATGPWISEPPFEAIATVNDLRVKKVVALHIEGVPAPDAPALFMPQSDAYLMPLPARNQWLFSFRCDEWDVRPRKHELEISGHDLKVAKSILTQYLPDLDPLCRGGRVFCDSYSPSGESLVTVDRSLNVVFAGSGSGAGFRLAPGIASEALELIVSEYPDRMVTVDPKMTCLEELK